MNLLLHITPHWAGEFSTAEWSIIIIAIAIGTVFAFIYAIWKNTLHQNQIHLGKKNNNNHTTTTIDVSRKFLVIYGLIAVGMALQIGGGKWDVTWHILQRPETFFTPPHAVLYSGVGMVVSSTAAELY
jgi:uncharacterized membrane protein YidH (DUF202 family)